MKRRNKMKKLLITLIGAGVLMNSAFAEEVKIDNVPLAATIQEAHGESTENTVEAPKKKKVAKKTKKVKKANKVTQ